MGCIEALIIPGPLWSLFRDHIYSLETREEVGALLVRADGASLRAVSFLPLTDEYVVSSHRGLQWHARFNVHLLRAARAANSGIMVAHTHPTEIWPRPSAPDQKTADALLDYFGKRMPNQTNIIAVFGKYGAFRAVAQRDGRRYAMRNILTT
jgi:hypothetical protein